ncbi:phospholipase D [Phlegmacium glaucopus]|nr:phospholipase D [Phlegmacium glaucopus]
MTLITSTSVDTPATRTGPPRSLSFAHTLPISFTEDPECLSSPDSHFRDALEYHDRKGKTRRDKGKSPTEEIWNPKSWFPESPKDLPVPESGPSGVETYQPLSLPTSPILPRPTTQNSRSSSSTARTALRRAFSVPRSQTLTSSRKGKEKQKDDNDNDNINVNVTSQGHAKWAKLRSLLPHPVHRKQSILPGPSVHAVSITDELITGGLSTLMLRLWFERDEKGRRRVPVLFHRLRIRVSDSLHPLQRHRSVFRIECEYANGAARWVIYRELKDFISLHTHYTLSNAVYNRNMDKLPEFPKTSLPYLKFLKKEGRESGGSVGRANFARLQREALETYLIDLIRAVASHMFHPSSNRLAGFLEISALSITLAQSGGTQSKAGYLRIGSTAGGFGRKSANWKANKEAWCAVRESYLVVLEEPGELDIFDVFLLDPDFKIERPKRYYRSLLHYEKQDNDHLFPDQPPPRDQISPPASEKRSVMSSIRTQVSKVFHLDPDTTLSNAHEHDANRSDSVSINSSVPSRAPTPMLDPSTNTNPLQKGGHDEHVEEKDTARKKKPVPSDVSKHTFYVLNSQTRLKISARNERQMLQFITALEKTAASSHYTASNRFDSFAPIRSNVAAQWLVDGRDYFWNLSRAILLAKESIYIHDWWISPELEMRRPNKERYRLDKLLERKAKEGVKIYVILYQEVSNRMTPTDSNYTKQKLVGLHPNVMVQRSPSHFQTGTFYWAHHEKMCVIDQTIAFMGGVDLCFGRWDTPQHVMTDDTADTDRSKIWPGKDYSNPRITDFFNLHKPEEDMYDRTKVPRMPWHDVAMQIIGHPARDLARHFVQRWNYLLRIKNHTRVMPFLLPPPEFGPGELTQLGLTGTCELQICRSAGPWSLGTPGRIEHSIQNAYLKAIQLSEHFVYIENQFFITSTVVNDVKVENNIGDAIVHRIIRAHRDRIPWKCCIMIPLLPGFTFPVEHTDASAIRIILDCQNRTISRGPNSIFSRLRKAGIDPDEYISVFSLRKWAKMRGDILTTEQIYIHGKVCIVDDRLAIIGSANINERSQRGDRDSELAAVIRDTDLIDRTMAGKPFKVGRFAHTLRVRLMREHLGIDVDALSEEDVMTHEPSKSENEQKPWKPEKEQGHGVTLSKKSEQKAGDWAGDASQTVLTSEEASSAEKGKVFRHQNLTHGTAVPSVGDQTLDEERKDFTEKGQKTTSFASSVVLTLAEKATVEQRSLEDQTDGDKDEVTLRDQTIVEESESSGRTGLVNGVSHELRTDDNVLFGAPANHKSPCGDGNEHPTRTLRSDVDSEERATASERATINVGNKSGRHQWTVPTVKPKVEPQDFEDPISDAFWKNIWVASAIHNTEIYRKVFHAIPDDLITTWKQYREFVAYHERLNKPTPESASVDPVAGIPSEIGDEGVAHESHPADSFDVNPELSKGGDDGLETSLRNSFVSTTQNEDTQSHRRPSKGSKPFEKWEREEMEKLLLQLNGQLVIYPNRFLEAEDTVDNFLFNADKLVIVLFCALDSYDLRVHCQALTPPDLYLIGLLF